MCLVDWFSLIGTVFATGLGAWFAYLFAMDQERKRDEKLHGALCASLLTEVEYNGELANTYVTTNISAPAYRFQRVVYDSAFPQLIGSGILKPDQVRALVEFYSQVNQVNWCMDEVHRYRVGDNPIGMSEEIGRLHAKLIEMKSPSSRFFNSAIAALGR